MKFKKLKLKNILSYKELEFNLDDQGICLLKGSNRAGKTNLIKGITFCLFGEGYDNVVNTVAKKDAFAELNLEMNSDEIIVRRYRKHSKFKNSLFVEVNGKQIEAASNKDMQMKLESFINCDLRGFNNIASFSSSMLSFADATDRERKLIFERILPDLELYELFYNNVNKRIKGKSQELLHLERKKEIDESEINLLLKFLKEEEIKSDSFLEDKEQKKREIEEKLKELETKDELDTSKLKEINVKLEKLKQNIDDLDTLRGNQFLLTTKIKDIKDYISFLSKNTECKLCGQHITSEFSKDAISKNRNKLKEYETSLLDLNKKIKTTEKKTEEIRKLSLKKAEVELELREKFAIEQQKERQREELKERLKKLETSENPHRESIKRLLEDIKKISKSISLLKSEIEEKSEEIVYLKEISKAFSRTGIPNNIISRALDFLEARINYYLAILSEDSLAIRISGKDIIASGEVRNKISLEVISQDQIKDVSFHSGGERQRINIAILLALRELASLGKGIKFNCIFLDEVLDLSLDLPGVDNVLYLLRKCLNPKIGINSIFILSPKFELIGNFSQFDKVYDIRYRQGFSSIREEKI